MRHTTLLHTTLLLSLLLSLAPRQPLHAQTYAQLRLWDSHERHPHVSQIEFDETLLTSLDSLNASLATYDALYGHGAMMENESYAIRVYMDARQSVDLYGKKTPHPELAVTDFYTTPELYAEGYGEDILFVGATIGAGTLRGYADGKPSLLRPVRARGQRVLYNQGDSSAIEVWDKGWVYEGHSVDLLVRYTMRLGRRDTQVDAWIEPSQGEPPFAIDSLTFLTGVQKLERDNHGLMLPDEGIVASWGSNEPEKETKPGDEQSLGIGLYVPTENLVAVYEDELNYLCQLHPHRHHLRYYLFVAPAIETAPDSYHTPSHWLTRMSTLPQWFSPMP